MIPSENRFLIKRFNAVSDYFGIGSVISFKRVGGNANENYLLKTAQGEFICKVLLEHPYVDLKKELIYLNHLKKYHYPVPYPVLAPNGSFIYKRKSFLAMVFPKISGKIPSISEKTNREAGKYLAKLHGLPYKNLPGKNHWLLPKYLPSALKVVQKHFPKEAKILYEKYDELRHFKLNICPQSIIHGDVICENLIFQGRKVAAVLDWEEVGIGSSLMDFARSTLALCFTRKKFHPKLFQALLKGYKSVKQLNYGSMEIETAIQYAVLTRSVWMLLQFGFYHKDNALKEHWKFSWTEGLDPFRIKL